MPNALRGFDHADFWADSDYARQTYVSAPLTGEMLAIVERTLGYRLPAAYVELSKRQNGGIPKRTCHRAPSRTTWAADHIAIHAISAISTFPETALCGGIGSRFWNDEWGYPSIGVYFADCPSAGHDMVCLDYSQCGPTGEPRVVHVDQEVDYRITVIAPSFEAFLGGLQDEGAFPLD
jgi:hypothetical protein